MATDRNYIQIFLEGLELYGVRVRPMMGEYVVYCNDKVVGDVCDNKLFVKITPESKALLPAAPELPPYAGAKPYLLVEDMGDMQFVAHLLQRVAEGLPAPKSRKKK